MYNKFNNYLNSGNENVQMYKQLFSTVAMLVLVYIINIYLADLIAPLENNFLYNVATIIHLTIVKTGYNVLLFITMLNVVLFGLKIFKDLDISIHLFLGHVLNLATMLLIIYSRMQV